MTTTRDEKEAGVWDAEDFADFWNCAVSTARKRLHALKVEPVGRREWRPRKYSRDEVLHAYGVRRGAA